MEPSETQMNEIAIAKFLEFKAAILNHPNDNMDELLELARRLKPGWDDEDDEWCREYAEKLEQQEE